MSHLGDCQFCGQRGPVAAVHYRQNTGCFVVRFRKDWAGDACRGCGVSWFWKATLHTLFLGPWGLISMIATPIFIVLNVVSVSNVLRLPRMEEMRKAALAEQREYAMNLLRTKDRVTVAEVLGRSTGASAEQIERFLRDL